MSANIRPDHLRPSLAALALLAALATGCRDQPDREPALAQAFVAPSTLQLRKELVARAPLVATLKHGDRVDILARRRRFYKIRTADDVTGWTDSRQLLSIAGMEQLKELARQTAQAPPQGEATVFEALNVHTAPNRQAPTLFQITPSTKVAVIAHERVPRIPYDPPVPLLPAPPGTQAIARKQKGQEQAPVPPAPPAPKTSKNRKDSPPPPSTSAAANSTRAEAGPASPPEDIWTLVRAQDGRSGWVLARMLLMALPDEVAQYAERARIAAFFPVGSVTSRGVKRTSWLWATSSRSDASNTFDSIRVFVWSTRRQRYETSYIERNINGWLPIQVADLRTGQAATFSFTAKEKDGALKKRTYTLLPTFRARLASRGAPTPARKWYVAETAQTVEEPDQPEPPARASWRSRISAWWSNLRGR